MILLPAETLSRKLTHVDSLGRKPFFTDVFKDAQHHGQSQRRPNLTN